MNGAWARVGVALTTMSMATLLSVVISAFVIWRLVLSMAESVKGSSSMGAGLALGFGALILIGIGLVIVLIVTIGSFVFGLALANTKFAHRTPWWGLVGYPLAALELAVAVYCYCWYQGVLRAHSVYGPAPVQTPPPTKQQVIVAPPAPGPIVAKEAPTQAGPQEVDAAGTEVRLLLGDLYFPGAQVSTMSQRAARTAQGASWPSITLVPPADTTPDQVISFYRQLAPDANIDAAETYRANAQRPGDGVNTIVYVFRAKFGPEAGRMVVMFMSP